MTGTVHHPWHLIAQMDGICRDFRFAVRALVRTPLVFATAVLTLAAGTGLATGVFAVTYFFVTSRSREIGVRMVLGANAGQVVRAVMLPTLRFALPGAAAGFVGALLLGRTMQAALYETSLLDPGVVAGATAVLTAAVIAASYFPVRRALAVNPVDVLRSE